MAFTGDYFYDIVVMSDDDEDDPIILEGMEVLVEVLEDGVWDDSQIYNNEALSDVKINPFVTDESGEMAFWAPKGEYKITITDLQIVPRTDQREHVWMSIPYSDFDKLRFAGEVVMSGRLLPPEGWLACNGAAVSRTQYAKLFNAIGIAYGPGNGGTTFNLPPFNHRFPVGAGVEIEVGDTDPLAELDRSPTHLHSMQGHVHPMPHTHAGQAAGAAGLATSAAAAHAHTFASGKAIASRQTDTLAQINPTGDESKLQTLYMPGFNSGNSSAAAPMDNGGGHAHTVDVAAAAVGVGQPSAASTSASPTADTSAKTTPHCGVNFFIKT